jgi:hypothetical protein
MYVKNQRQGEERRETNKAKATKPENVPCVD